MKLRFKVLTAVIDSNRGFVGCDAIVCGYKHFERMCRHSPEVSDRLVVLRIVTNCFL
jgi:hypothetical protein